MIDAPESEAETPQAGLGGDALSGERRGRGGLTGPVRRSPEGEDAKRKGGVAGGQDPPDSVSHQP